MFAVTELKNLTDSSSVTGMRCMGGTCLQSQDDLDTPIILFPLGREIETMPQEWQPIARSTGIPARWPEPRATAKPNGAEKFLGSGMVGLRLCADKLPE